MTFPVLDESVWKNWEKTGKIEFLKAVRTNLPTVTDASLLNLRNEEYQNLKFLVHDLFWKCVRGAIKRDQVSGAVLELVPLHGDLTGLIIDILCLLDIESLASKEDRERYLSLLREVSKHLPESTVKERMEIDTLGSAGVIESTKKFFTNVVRMKTKLYYKQQKFNLFREECEGYAKLITELNQDLSVTTPIEVLQIIKSIIGYFNLDPNRVLDVILDSFECQLDRHEFFVTLLREYTPDANTLNELVAFKFKFHTSEGDGTVPESLFRQTALMIQHGILELDAIYKMLGPTDEVIQAEAEKAMSEAKEFVRKMNIVSTKDKDEKSEDANSEANKKTPVNHKFGLLEALLNVGAWTHATTIISSLPTYHAVSQPSIASALCNLIHITMDPVHKRYCGITPRLHGQKYVRIENSGAPPQAHTLEEFQTTVLPMLLAVGPYASVDPVLLYKVIRIAKTALKISTTESGKDRDKIAEQVDPSTTVIYYDILTLMDEVFLPALSLSESNCCLAEEIWTVLRVYPYHARYRLYGQWKMETYNLHPILMRKKAAVQKDIKRIMQRISKENVKPTSRALGKKTHSSPGLLFEYVLSQIQLYDNLIGPVVDSLRYLTSLSFDVLGYSIIEALNNPDKDRTKHDGTSISLWLQSLSNFCGSVFKKYNVELTGILQYVANQLKSKKSLDLLILKEIVVKMSGIESAEEMTADQIDAMAGGELVRQEAGFFNQIKNTKKSSQRLKDALIDNNLAVPLCLLMAQQRTCVVYQETEDSHLKLVGKLFDQCQDTLVQFGQFLATNLSIDDYTFRLPPMSELLTLYHVNSDLAFFLARPMFNHQISLKYDEMRRQDKNWKNTTDAEKQKVWVDAALQVMEPVTQAMHPLHPKKIWDDISPQFLTTFWSLTMYDLYVPHAVYEREIAKLKALPAKVDENKELNSARKKKEKERIAGLIDKMVEEEKRQVEHVERVMARLRKEKDGWFFSRSPKMAKNETITAFLQLCLFPRCVFTASDATYCAKFVQVIHTLKTPNFSTLLCFDRIFCDITYTVTSCTENEATRYGRFLAAMLEIVMRWHSERQIFEKECVGFPGFITKFRVATEKLGQGASDDTVDYENYRHVCHKWHYKVAKALVVCLESKDYVQIRNALTVLTKILPHFPVIANLAGVIEKRIEKVCADEKENRKDLYIKATSYSGQLKARKNQMLKEQEFHLTNKKGSTTNSNSGESVVSLPAPVGPASGSNLKTESESDSKSRSVSREKSLTKSDREKETPDRKARKERDRESKERSREDRSSKDRSSSDRERKSRERDRHDMGPPQSASQHRRSAEPASEDRDVKRRKVEPSSTSKESSSSAEKGKERKRDRESAEKSTPAPTETSAKKDKKTERKKDSPVSTSAETTASTTKRRKDAVTSSSTSPTNGDSSSDRKTRTRREGKSGSRK